MVVGLSDLINQFMKGPFLFIDLFLTNIALRNEIVVFSLILKIGQVNFIHNSSVIFLEQLHVAHQILLMILQDGLDSLLTSLVLANDQLISLGLPAGKESLQLFIHKVCLINGQKVLIFGLFIDYLTSIRGTDAILYLSNF